jgi:hypothetical protein
MDRHTQGPEEGFELIRTAFNRALMLTFSKKKLLFCFSILAMCGLLVVFFRGLAIHSGHWVTMSLTFLPVFICAGIMLSLGLVLIRIYHHEVKARPVSYRDILQKSVELMIGATYISVPFVLVYLLLWMLLGIFFLLKQIPGMGDFIGLVLAFGPFLLNLASLFLMLSTIMVLFFVTPALSLRSLDRMQIVQLVFNRIRLDVFSNVVHFLVATLPLLLTAALLTLAAILTGFTYLDIDHTSEIILQWFFIMLPFTALLAPAIVFFFNFAAESHVTFEARRRTLSR